MSGLSGGTLQSILSGETLCRVPQARPFDLFGGTSIELSVKTCEQVFGAGYCSCLLGVILVFGHTHRDTKYLMRELGYPEESKSLRCINMYPD